jgi:aminoglycoside phosphotransferase (APT) family kinase protein
MSGARRVGGTVRRPVGDHTPFVHRLLRHLEAVGFPGAPRVLGVEDGEEVLTYVEGHVPVEVAPEEVEPVVFSPAGIASAFALIRRYHDATAGSGLAGGAEVVCHGDLSPWNTVYAGARGAVGLIDWDGARPGSRSDDAGYAVWRHLMLGHPGAPPLMAQRRLLAARRWRTGSSRRPSCSMPTAGAQEAQRRVFVAAGAARDPRYLRLIGRGALETIAGAQVWLVDHRGRLLR